MNKIIRFLKENGVLLSYFSFFLLLFFELSLFRRFVHADIAPFYPTNFDQGSYLLMVYSMYAMIQKVGVYHGLLNSPILSTGALFPIQAVMFFLLAGASRFHALLINFIYFAFLQLFIFNTAKKIFNRFSIAFIFFGLLLSINCPTFDVGGITDFRIDFIAFCLYGIFVTSVVRSKVFLDLKWSLISALFSIILIAMRSLTAVYVFGLTSFLFLYFFAMYYRAKENLKLKAETITRIKNLITFSLVIAIITLPILWHNREALYNYYVIGHITGKEKYIRALISSTTSYFKDLLYYPKVLIIHNIGTWLTVFSVLISTALLTLKRKSSARHRDSNLNYSYELYFLLISFLIPLIALTIDMQKSDVVSTVMIIPILWMFVYWIFKTTRAIQPKIRNKTLITLAILTILFGCIHQLAGYKISKIPTQRKKELAQISNMYIEIGDYFYQKQSPTINLSLSQIDDRLTNANLAILYFEKKHILLHVNIQPLGGSIFAINQSDAIKSLKNSNVAIFDINHNPGCKLLPFNASVDQIKPVLLAYLYKNFYLLNTYPIGKQILGVFVK